MKHLSYITTLCAVLLAAGACDKNTLDNPPVDVINGYFLDEIKPKSTYECFAGAYYRKVVSSKDKWIGISGTVTLPTISFDQTRTNLEKPGQYLDNPSVYLGGNANGQETDIGMTWEVIKDQQGTISLDRRAFRPFMRRAAYTGTGQASNYSNAPAEPQYYWYPGEEITLSLMINTNGTLTFSVVGAGKSYETTYDCDAYNFGSYIEFKRVNAIDQVANEGKPIQPTKTRVENAYWKETNLYRKVDTGVVKVPMHTGRFTDMRCPDIKYFSIGCTTAEGLFGAESITIDGNK